MYLTCDVGGSKILYAVWNRDVMVRKEKIYYNERGIDSKSKLRRFLKELFDVYDIKKASFSVAGYVQDGRVVVSPNAEWMNGFDFSSFGSVVENDANVFAYSQYLKYNRDVVGIIWGTGIGGGIVVNGHILKGVNGFAGEIGHMFANEEQVYEDVLGSKGLSANLNRGLYPLEIYKKDKDAFISYALPYLSNLVVSLYELLDINLFVFGGGVGSNLDDVFYDYLKKEVLRKIKYHPFKNIEVVRATYGEEDVLITLKRMI